jgi:membrane protein required for beta-lactamase induction
LTEPAVLCCFVLLVLVLVLVMLLLLRPTLSGVCFGKLSASFENVQAHSKSGSGTVARKVRHTEVNVLIKRINEE